MSEAKRWWKREEITFYIAKIGVNAGGLDPTEESRLRGMCVILISMLHIMANAGISHHGLLLL